MVLVLPRESMGGGDLLEYLWPLRSSDHLCRVSSSRGLWTVKYGGRNRKLFVPQMHTLKNGTLRNNICFQQT